MDRFLSAGRRLVCAALLLLVVSAAPSSARAQEIAKYGAEFLSGGVGARAIGMGGAYVGLAGDVTAGYWNAAGLHQLQYPEISYMHVERFGGVVSFDYAGAAFPINERSTLGLLAIRSGVNDIVNTLNAYGFSENGTQPLPDYRNRITRFSAADYLFGLSFARSISEQLSVGATGKVSRRSIGDFADAWGYSVDLSAQYQWRRYSFGLNLQDAFPYIQSWSVNPEAFEIEDFEEKCTDEQGNFYEECLDDEGNLIDNNGGRFDALFSQEIPEGQTELVLPTARLGAGRVISVDEKGSRVTVGLGLDVRFDGRRAYLPNLGDVSFEPSIGAEFSYRGIVAVRGGINRVQYGEGLGLDLTPSVGAGFNLKQFSINYAFGDFGGAASDLGYTHRISARLRLEQPNLKRGSE